MLMQPSKLLIVEDDEDIRETLAELLALEGFAVLTATNGKDALDQLSALETLPSLIILDLMMPVMDGPTFRAQQCLVPRLADIPVVVMSADGRLEARQAEMKTADFLRKPVDINRVLTVVHKHCKTDA